MRSFSIENAKYIVLTFHKASSLLGTYVPIDDERVRIRTP